MKIAIIADIHSNLEALQKVLKSIEKEKPDKIICLGDIVGYGANPDERCELVRKHCDLSIMGNHDAAVCNLMLTEYFVRHAEIAVLWTRKIMKENNVEWLSNLPITIDVENILFSHGAPYSPKDFVYVIDYESALLSIKSLELSGKKICFVGHSHILDIFWRDKNVINRTIAETFVTKNKMVSVINVGSTGQPRDGNPFSAWGLYDTDGDVYKVFRTSYDITRASEKIIQAGLPEILAIRLFSGR